MTATATASALPPDLPRVQGRHRNKVLAARRRDRAVQLITEGMTYQQAADYLGYTSRGTVHQIVRKALERQEAKSVASHRQLSVERLEALLRALWPHVEKGDVQAIRTALQVEDRWCRVLDLFPDRHRGAGRQGHGGCGRPDTVVVHADCLASRCADHAARG